jgi:hypothetical protein
LTNLDAFDRDCRCHSTVFCDQTVGLVGPATLTRVFYLGPERSGVRWLLDPAAPELAGLAMLVLVDGQTKSSGESAAWMLQQGIGGLLIGGRTAGMIEYGNITPYLLPASGLHVGLTTKHNDFGVAVELVGFPVHAELDPRTPLSFVTRAFDRIHADALARPANI